MKVYIKMEKAIIKLDDIEIPKQTFHQFKRTISIKNVDNDEKVVSNKIRFGKLGFKYFIGYKKIKRIKPLCVFSPKTIAYRKYFDETKYIYILFNKR